MRKSFRITVHVVSLMLLLAVSAGTVSATPTIDPLLFDSMATIEYSGSQNLGSPGSGSVQVFYYDLHLSSASHPYHELYINLDAEEVTPHQAQGQIGGDVQFLTADILSHPSVDLFFAADRRAFANMNNADFLDNNNMYAYLDFLTDPLPADTHALDIRFGVNRMLSGSEMYKVGYWVGDLRGQAGDSNYVFTESDGTPIPEPATLTLALAGLAGLAGLRRRARR